MPLYSSFIKLLTYYYKYYVLYIYIYKKKIFSISIIFVLKCLNKYYASDYKTKVIHCLRIKQVHCGHCGMGITNKYGYTNNMGGNMQF